MSLSINIFKGDPDKSFILNYAPIFSSLNFFDKNLIIQKSKVVFYRKGEIIYKHRTPADGLYCVITGRVKLFRYESGKENVVEYLSCGKVFGIISVLTDEVHSLNAQAANDSKILYIPKDDFRLIINKIPRLGFEFSLILSRRLRQEHLKEKKIFESNIICIYSFTEGITSSYYSYNLAFNLSKETNRKVILIVDFKEKEKFSGYQRFKFKKEPKAIELLRNLPSKEVISSAVGEDLATKTNILYVNYSKDDDSYARNFINLLTYFTNNYHYVVAALEELEEIILFEILSQADSIHLISDSKLNNLEKVRVFIKNFCKETGSSQEKIKPIVIRKRNDKTSSEEIKRTLGLNIYAIFSPSFKDKKTTKKIIDDKEYFHIMRRIAREIGDVRVGLALGGGAAYGLSHIGVIKVLEKENIPVDMVVGSSMGALIGALWATGLDAEELEKIALSFDNKKKKSLKLLGDFKFPPYDSLIAGNNLRNFLKTYLGDKTFRDLRFPFKIVACNLLRREEVIYDSGSLLEAVMASVAIPGFFPPLGEDGDVIIDGGIIEPVPIGTLVKLGMKKIIAVNVLPSPEEVLETYKMHQERDKQSNFEVNISSLMSRLSRYALKKFSPFKLLDIVVNSIQTMQYVIAESDCEKADVVIKPHILGVDWYELYKASFIIRKGEEEAYRKLDDILALIKE